MKSVTRPKEPQRGPGSCNLPAQCSEAFPSARPAPAHTARGWTRYPNLSLHRDHCVLRRSPGAGHCSCPQNLPEPPTPSFRFLPDASPSSPGLEPPVGGAAGPNERSRGPRPAALQRLGGAVPSREPAGSKQVRPGRGSRRPGRSGYPF